MKIDTVGRLLFLLQKSAKLGNRALGKNIHAHIIKLGMHLHRPLPNNLIHMYGKCSLHMDAHKLFGEIPQRDAITYASILSAHVHSNLPRRALSIFRDMILVDRVEPDGFIFATVINACACLAAEKQAKQLHAQLTISSYFDDNVVKSALVDMYSKCKLPNDARKVFDTITLKNSVCWTAMVSGYAKNGHPSDAIDLFYKMPDRTLLAWTALISGFVQNGDVLNAFRLFGEMRHDNVSIADSFVISCLVGSSSNLATLEIGKQLHGLVIVLGYESSMIVSNALVDMYAKCSDLSSAKVIFNENPSRDVISWTTIIMASALHGQAKEALLLYDKMILNDIEPNEVTFLGLIYACSHAGLVDKGRILFDSMFNDFEIKPSLQHYTCLLDLYGRSGLLKEAENLIKTMPFEPDEAAWAALLSACNWHRNDHMGIRIANHILSLKPRDPSTYILLSNAYATSGTWGQMSMVRRLMEELDIRKEPGHSWIEVGKESYTFYAGDVLHPLKDDILQLLKELGTEMNKRGYIPDTRFVLHDLEDQEKNQ